MILKQNLTGVLSESKLTKTSKDDNSSIQERIHSDIKRMELREAEEKHSM